MKDKILNALQAANSLLEEFLSDNRNIETIETFAQVIANVFENGNKIIIAGNGGSAADAMHFAEEFTGKFRKERKALPVIAIPDSSHITCVSNDFGFEHIFSRQIEAFAKSGDVFIGLSTSGNSQNIIKALEYAKKNDMITLGLLGKDGGQLKGLFNQEIIIPATTSDRIQEIHMTILHIIIEMVERELFPENYS